MSTISAEVDSPRPTADLRISAEGRKKIRDTEAVRFEYYNDMGKNKGHCTWGIGVLAHRGVCTEEELGRRVSAAEVEAEFSRKLREAEDGVRRHIGVHLNQTQFDALVSFTFNTGVEGADDTYKLINNNDFTGAAANMQQFVRVRVKTKHGVRKVIAGGLVRRRAEEAAPFLRSKK